MVSAGWYRKSIQMSETFLNNSQVMYLSTEPDSLVNCFNEILFYYHVHQQHHLHFICYKLTNLLCYVCVLLCPEKCHFTNNVKQEQRHNRGYVLVWVWQEDNLIYGVFVAELMTRCRIFMKVVCVWPAIYWICQLWCLNEALYS